MFDHHDYSSHFEEKEEEEGDGLNEDSFSNYMKYGDELLIDMIRARPYLYDKAMENYKDTQMKENAWLEIANTLNMTRK